MSSGPSCKCAESKKPPTERAWRVTQRNCNHSAFNGYHQTWSKYSALLCLACGCVWRTTARYVASIKDMTKEEQEARYGRVIR